MYFVIADDHHLVREALLPFIEKVSATATLLQADSLEAAQVHCDRVRDKLALIVLDWHMPGMQGALSLRNLRQTYPAPIKIVVLSGIATAEDAMASLKSGADGFIPKSLSGSALTNALRLVLEGEHFFPSSLLSSNAQKTYDSRHRRDLGPLGELLSPQEHDVIELLLDGLSNRDIAQRLHVQEVTIKKRLSNAYRKLGVNSRLQAVQVVNAARQG